MQERITGFVAGHSRMSADRFKQLMLHTGELVMDMGTVLEGRRAVEEGLIDQLGGLSEAMRCVYREIEATERGAKSCADASAKSRGFFCWGGLALCEKILQKYC